MNNKVYDNGEMLLGMVKDVIKYLFENMEYDEDDYSEVKGMIEDLEELGDNYIVMINYDFGMGYLLYKWHIESDVVMGDDE